MRTKKHEHLKRRFLMAFLGAIKRSGYTVASFADAIGVERSHMSRVVNGRAELSTVKWRAALRVLGIKDAYLEAAIKVLDGVKPESGVRVTDGLTRRRGSA